MLPGATPRFSFLFGNRVDGNWTIPCLGSCGGSKWSHFLASASAIFWRYQLAPFYYSDSLCFSLTRAGVQGIGLADCRCVP